jgi:methylated-DNA-protein-cysteine methyltransferase-like protein
MGRTPKDTNDFFKDVYDVVRLIPPGKVTSYGAIARYLGSARSSRIVGWAMNASHRQANVPAHRVLNRLGMLTGKHHFGEPTEMQRRLEAEGIIVKNDQVQNWNVLFWDPNKELKLP